MLFDSDDVPPLSPRAQTPADLDGRWCLVQVASNHEKKVAAILATADVGYFLPLLPVVIRDAAGKRRHQRRPMFAGYVFACLRHDDDRYELSHRDSVYRVIDVANSAQATFVRELCGLHSAMASGISMDPFPFAVKGSRCAITNRHPLRALHGIEGTVEYRDHREVLVLRIEILGQSVSMEIDPAYLEPA